MLAEVADAVPVLHVVVMERGELWWSACSVMWSRVGLGRSCRFVLVFAQTIMDWTGLPHEQWRRRRDRVDAIGHMVQLLCTISTSLIMRIIKGDIPILARRDMGIKDELLALSARETQPGLYVLYITDEEGLSPSTAEWHEALRLVDIYANMGDAGDDLARQIDSKRGKEATNRRYVGRRKYLLSQDDKGVKHKTYTEACQKNLLDFISSKWQLLRGPRGRHTSEVRYSALLVC